ncbi:MAG: 3'(2'),5'-bisphosphate nucleotidase CysQ [Pseudonocardiales bacterium]
MTVPSGHEAQPRPAGPAQLDPADDHALAARLAEAAGAALIAARGRLGFADGAALRDAGDRCAQELLAEWLGRARPEDAVLSEEASDDLGRLGADRVWIIDPLDGTREYAEEGRSDWAVHVALWVQGRLTAGAVALPARGVTLGTAAPRATAIAPARPVRLAVSRTRPPDVARDLATALQADLVPMGSSGAKTASVIMGDVDAYVHAGGQYEWDSAAPVAVAVAAGLHASRLDGSALRYNQRDPYLPDLLICLPHLARRILELIAAREGIL